MRWVIRDWVIDQSQQIVCGDMVVQTDQSEAFHTGGRIAFFNLTDSCFSKTQHSGKIFLSFSVLFSQLRDPLTKKFF